MQINLTVKSLVTRIEITSLHGLKFSEIKKINIPIKDNDEIIYIGGGIIEIWREV